MDESVGELPGGGDACALCGAPMLSCMLLATCAAGQLANEGLALAANAEEGLRVAEDAGAQVERLERENLNMRRALRRTMMMLQGLAVPPMHRPAIVRAAESIRDDLRGLGEEG